MAPGYEAEDWPVVHGVVFISAVISQGAALSVMMRFSILSGFRPDLYVLAQPGSTPSQTAAFGRQENVRSARLKLDSGRSFRCLAYADYNPLRTLKNDRTI